MTRERQSTLEASLIMWPALRNHIPCMAHGIRQALCAFMSSLGVYGRTRSREAHKHNQRFGDNVTLDNEKSPRLRKEGNARINKMSATNPGLARIIEKVCTSRCCESPETDLLKAENGCCIDCVNTWTLKRVHWQSNSLCQNRSTPDFGSEDMLEHDSGVTQPGILITGIQARVASKSKIQCMLATLRNSGRMDHCEVCNGCVEAIPILDPVDVEEAYSHIASLDHSIKRHVRSHGQRNANFGKDENWVEGKLVICRQVSSTEAVQILSWCHSIDAYACHFSTYLWSFPEVAIVQEVAHGNGYKS